MAQRYIDFSTLSPTRFPKIIADLMVSQSVVDSTIYKANSSNGTVFFRPIANSWGTIPLVENQDNIETVICFKTLALPSVAYSNTGCGLYFKDSVSSNFYAISSGSNNGSGTNFNGALHLSKSTDGSSLGGSNSAISTRTLIQSMQIYKYIRVKKSGSTYQIKAWWSDNTEPSQWGYTITNNLWTGENAGVLLHGYGIAVEVKFASYGTDGDSAPLSMTNRKVEGILYNPDDTVAINQIVRLYLKETGCLLGEVISGSTGAYSFSVPVYEDQLVQIVGVDLFGNEWKPPIHEVYPIL